jgi:hypothetical protein
MESFMAEVTKRILRRKTVEQRVGLGSVEKFI